MANKHHDEKSGRFLHGDSVRGFKLHQPNVTPAPTPLGPPSPLPFVIPTPAPSTPKK